MKGLSKIWLRDGFVEHSRRDPALRLLACGDDKASLSSCTSPTSLNAWEYQTDELALVELSGKPAGRPGFSEANLDLVHFLEPSLASLKKAACVTKRVVLVPIAEQIAAVAEEENARLGNHVAATSFAAGATCSSGAIPDQVTRLSPCPVLSIAPLSLPSRGAEMGAACNSLAKT